MVRFVLVGGVNTAVHYGLYLLLVPHLRYTAAFVTAFALATVGSFFLNTAFTYRTSVTWGKFLRFPLSTMVNLAVSTAALGALVELAGVGDRMAPLLAGALAVPVTFFVARRVMLGERPSGGAATQAQRAAAGGGNRIPARSGGMGVSGRKKGAAGPSTAVAGASVSRKRSRRRP